MFLRLVRHADAAACYLARLLSDSFAMSVSILLESFLVKKKLSLNRAICVFHYESFYQEAFLLVSIGFLGVVRNLTGDYAGPANVMPSVVGSCI